VDGITEVDVLIYGTQAEAIARMHELNAKEKAPEQRNRSSAEMN
jgi:hypothetical protein